jgi:AAA family ATP:ADP antiporter
VLFTVVSRDDKYKAKSFIDTVVYRAGDSVSAWAYSALQGLELAVSGITLVAAGLSSAWLAVAWLLGRGHDRLTRARP